MRTCPSCGAENPDQARFCMRCATPLESEEAAAREVRKTVTVLFCDLSGSTALGERLDPEAMRRVQARYFAAMREAVERHGGTVEKYIGDAVMAVFGIPRLHEDDALRAVRAAADMHGGLDALNEDLQREHGIGLAVRIGLNTGEVVAGDPSRGQRLVTGDTVNVAARFEQAAAPGEILIGETTRRLVRDAIEAEPVPPLELKGKSAPVPAFRVHHVTPGAEGVERRLDSPMVGRERHLRMLRQAFDAAVEERTAHLFTVLGTAGVGKSRLVAEFLARLPRDALVLRGRCLSYGEGITFRPVVEMIRTAAGIGEEDEPGERRTKLAAALEGEGDADAIAERVAALIGTGDAVAAPEETFWAIRRFLEELARERPVVSIVDDVHWAEPKLLDLLDYLADWIREAPVFLVCSARPDLLERRPGWGGGKFNATAVLLEPLGDEDCSKLIDNLLGAELPGEVRSRILAAAGGTPLFVEEMVSMLIDEGLLERWEGRWVPAGGLATVRVPPTIQALLAARLDQLPAGERSVLESGAIEGISFHRGAVEELAPAGVPVATDLAGLARRELIRPDRAELAGQEAFRFRHQLIRDAAYEAIPKARRAELHERFADWLERTSGAADFPAILGFHLEQAARYLREIGSDGDRAAALADRAGVLLAEAGRRAIALADQPGATSLLSRAVELLPRGDRRRVEAMLDLTEPLRGIGELEAAERLGAEAVEEAEAMAIPALSMRARVVATALIVDPPRFETEAGLLVPEALRFFEAVGDHRGLASTWRLETFRQNLVGHPPALLEACQRVIEHSRLAGDPGAEAEGMVLLGMQLFWGPTPVPEGIRLTEGMLARVRGRRLTEALLERGIAGFLGMLGRFDEARRLADRCRATFLEAGAEMWANSVAFMDGPMELMAGDPMAAERILRAACDQLRDIGERSFYSSLVSMLGEALYRQDRYDEAYECTVAAEKAAAPGDLEAQGDFRALRGKVLARRGDLTEGERLVREGIEMASGSDEPDHDGDNWFDLAEVLRLAGRDDEAAEAMRTAIGFWEAKGNMASAANGRAFLAELERA